jgi:hypothetical protein
MDPIYLAQFALVRCLRPVTAVNHKVAYRGQGVDISTIRCRQRLEHIVRRGEPFAPHAVDRPQIDAATNYQGSSREAYLQRLGARELVEAPGREVKASDHLFD